MRSLAVTAALAVAIFCVVAQEASAAAPEFGRCVKTAGGKWKNAKCTAEAVPGEEKYEWFPGVVKNNFTIALKSGTLITMEGVGGGKFTCSGESGSGEYVGTKSIAGVVLRFTGCLEAGGKCTTPGEPAGTIATSVLEGVLGVEIEGGTPATDKLALSLHAKEGAWWAQYECQGFNWLLRGSVLHPIVENAMKLTETEKYSAAKGIQKPDHFVSEPAGSQTLEREVNGNPFEVFGFTLTSILTNEESLEANTVI